MKRRGQKEHSKQDGINKTNLYLNNTNNEIFKTLLWFYYWFSLVGFMAYQPL